LAGNARPARLQIAGTEDCRAIIVHDDKSWRRQNVGCTAGGLKFGKISNENEFLKDLIEGGAQSAVLNLERRIGLVHSPGDLPSAQRTSGADCAPDVGSYIGPRWRPRIIECGANRFRPV
jgi:hypothetical protein